MVRILQILPSFNTGGVEHTTLRVANALSDKGLQNFVVSNGGGLAKKLHKQSTHITAPSIASKNPFLLIFNCIRLIYIVKKYSIDIVHVRSRAPAWSAYIICKILSKKFITTYHGAYSQNRYKWFYNWVMSKGNPVVVASQFMQNHVKSFYPNSKTTQIPSGIDTNFFKTKSYKKKNNNYQKTIMLLGRFTKIKGHHYLLQAISSSENLKKNFKVLFLGDSNNPILVNYLKTFAINHSINLTISTNQNNIKPYLNAADIVVIPTTKPEAFGRVTVEAMSMEKLVIVNNLGASPEVLGDDNWVYNIDDTGQNLAKKLEQALSLSDEELKIIGHNNLRRAVELYDLNIMLDRHFKLYGIN